MDGHGGISKRVVAAVAVVVVTAVLSAAGAAWATHHFSDVDDDATHAAAIAWLQDRGITKGCTTTSFCPDDPVTRAEMASFLRRLSGTDPSVPPSVNAATIGGLTAQQLQGQSGGTGPTGPAGPPGPPGPPGPGQHFSNVVELGRDQRSTVLSQIPGLTHVTVHCGTDGGRGLSFTATWPGVLDFGEGQIPFDALSVSQSFLDRPVQFFIRVAPPAPGSATTTVIGSAYRVGVGDDSRCAFWASAWSA